MMLLPEMLNLWDDAGGAFKQRRTWSRARRLGLSQFACLERHTITGLICTSGRQFEDWSGDYRLFSKCVWRPDDLFRPVISGSLQRLPASHPVVVAIDHTLLRKSGKKTPGVAYRRDPLSPAFQTNLVLGQRFIQFSIPHDRAPRRYGPEAPTPEELRQDDQYGWQEIEAYAAGKTHTFRVKTLGPLRWRKTGTACPLRVVVIAPIGYRLRQGARLLYRQPAYLICTDPNLPLAELLQEYLWRWDIEVNHRDEKQIIGVGQAQVRSPKSVDRQPAFAVANYALLLLAGRNAFGPDATSGGLSPAKWQRRCARYRVSTQQFIQEFREEVWNRAMGAIAAIEERTDFVTAGMPDAKSSEATLAPAPPLAFARSG